MDLGSGNYVCPKHGSMVCPICGSVLIELKYMDNKADVLYLSKRAGFYCFMGCTRTDLHNKVVDGVDFRGKVFIKAIFKGDVQLAV